MLVIEDEPAVRALIIEGLRGAGYRTLEAADGPSGLAVLQSAARIDLLVTDIGLPGITGPQVAVAARAGRPDLKVLFVTGYSRNVAAGFLVPGMEVLTKPFALNVLAMRVRAMLEDTEQRTLS